MQRHTSTARNAEDIERTPTRAHIAEPTSGAELTIGSGFRARSFRVRDVGEAMDPLVMVDHYRMTEPTFGAHPHAGMSAVTLLFEDTEGLFHNRDSLGNDLDLRPGDLYWLKAGSGAVHDEYPRPRGRVHGLQVFVNVPQSQRYEQPAALLVRAADMPVISATDHRVKVVLGTSNDTEGAGSPAQPMTILDGTIEPGGSFSHRALPDSGVWIHSIEGKLDVAIDRQRRCLAPQRAVAAGVHESTDIRLHNPGREALHFALFNGPRIAETYVQEGPFVMGSSAEIDAVRAAYHAGRLGHL